MKKLLLVLCILPCLTNAQQQKWQGKFEQLDQALPTPNEFRSASGMPGAKYWQQRADYTIDAEIDEAKNILKAKEIIVYHNNSPENLKYLWLQLDQNINKEEAESFGSFYGPVRDSLNTLQMQRMTRAIEFPGGYTIASVKDGSGNDLQITINKTMMRIDLPSPLKSGDKYTMNIEWSYPITNRANFLLSREGYEYFPEDNNTVYLIGHWFPRMCVFNDTEGWQNKQFQRLGEFALEFGDYKVNITVPADHIISSTGLLQNAKDVLSPKELERYEKGKTSFDKPLLVVTPDEAKAKEKTKATTKKTWTFHADNVRDFAFASSRKFIWDVQAVKLPTNTVLAMSFYPKEGLPVWQEESTLAIKNALEIYSKYSFDYPYPTANSVNTSNIGMEFPMISFNGGRPKDGKMSDAAKEGMIGTIVHEVGHNWFPMIVSSDERQWMWMDEGLNTFLQTRTEMERYPHFGFTRPASIVPYMKGDKSQMRPVMVTSDNERLTAFGNNYYNKPTVALTILRETVIGEELFDKAFKEYSNAWKFKHPNPADLFRIIEESTATDLDWFWRGWFMTTDNVDMSVEEVKWFKLRSQQTDPENKNKNVKSGDLSAASKSNTDFSSGPQEFTLMDTPEELYGEFKSKVDDNAVRKKLQGKNIYEVKFKNRGGLVMPLIIEWTYKDGSKEREVIPAEVWRINEEEVTKVFIKDKEVVNMVLDPKNDLADVDESNNVFPKSSTGSQFDAFKKKN